MIVFTAEFLKDGKYQNFQMTDKLVELFELPTPDLEVSDVTDKSSVLSLPEEPVVPTELSTALDRVDAAIPQISGLEYSDVELDELADLATSTFKDLQSLGMQVEPRFAAPIFQSASSMLGHAITAKTAKIDRKLKMLDMQLKAIALDKKKVSSDISNETSGGGNTTNIILDRNELLKLSLESRTTNVIIKN